MACSLDIVRDCSVMLTSAESDVDKIAALLFAAQHIRNDECDSESKALLFNSVGADFLSRMLLGHLTVPDSEDCPKETYASTALAIITGFCVDPDLARNAEMLRLVPHILQILESCDESLLEEALQYLRCIIQHPEGRRSLLSHGVLKRFARLYSRLKSDEIVDMTLILTQTPGVDDVWDQNTESFTSLISEVAGEFERNHSKRKFKLCSALRCLIYSYNKDKVSNEAFRVVEWHGKVLRGLRDILTSRTGDEQRDPALKLAAMMLDHFGIAWYDGDREGSNKFQLLLVRLSSIEVRMQLEDQPLEKILKNADLVTSCFTILEVAITQFLQRSVDLRIENQIIQSFTAAGTAVMVTIKSIIDSPGSSRNTREGKFFIYAMIRFLSLGFAHEVLTLKASVYEIMPFVVGVATDSFYTYKNWYEENVKMETNALAPVVGIQPADFFPVLLPALRHFVTEEKGRKLVLGMMDVFLDYLNFHWSTVEHHLTLIRKLQSDGNTDRSALILKEKNEVWLDAKNTMVCLFELLIETVIIQPEVTENPKFPLVFAFITEKLPLLDPDINAIRPLHATVSILGLLLIKHQKEKPSENDPNAVLVIRSSLWFFKPYFNKVRTYDDSVFASNTNPKFWVNIKELWFLGMYTLRKLLKLLPWIKPDIESTLGPAVMEYLSTDLDLVGSYGGPP